MEQMPGLTLQDLGACSGCRAATLLAVYCFSQQKLLKPLRVVYGGGISRRLQPPRASS